MVIINAFKGLRQSNEILHPRHLGNRGNTFGKKMPFCGNKSNTTGQDGLKLRCENGNPVPITRIY